MSRAWSHPVERPERGDRLLFFRGRGRQRIVRSFLQAAFGLVSKISPRMCAIPAESLFRSPPRHRRTRAEQAVLAEGTALRVPIPGGSLAAWTWGEGPRVLLVHGWGGHAGRLARYVHPLLEAGFSVVAFDAPAHGLSTGKRCSLPEFVGSILVVAAAVGKVTAVVAHSVGAAACALALRRGLSADRAVLLAPPADPEHYVDRFARFFGIPKAARDFMKERLVSRYGTKWEDLRVPDSGPPTSCRLLVFHDGRDNAVPFRDGISLVSRWGDASLVRTSGLGHHRIVREPRVIAEALVFLSGPPCAPVKSA